LHLLENLDTVTSELHGGDDNLVKWHGTSGTISTRLELCHSLQSICPYHVLFKTFRSNGHKTG
jgi:hypothetical protein